MAQGYAVNVPGGGGILIETIMPTRRGAIVTNIEMRPCPACDAGNVFLTHTVRNLDARRHVECRICGMHGPVKTETVDAIVAWNELPRREQPRA